MSSRAVATAVVTTAVSALVTWVIHQLFRLPVWLVFLVIIFVAALVLAALFRQRVAEWVRPALPALRSALPIFLSAVIAFPVALGVNAVWHPLDSGRACSRPIDLRVIAAPESVTALRAAAQEFEQDRCSAVTISVLPEPPLARMMTGFASGWVESRGSSAEILYGPQPDIWISDSRIVAEGVLNAVQSSNPGIGKASLKVEQRIASSPIVLGLFSGYAGSAAEHGTFENGAASGTPLSRLVNELQSNDILGGPRDLVRAVPDTSESALLATPALYSASPGQQDTEIEQNQIRLRERVLGTRQAFPDGAAVLCHFRREQGSGAEPPRRVAVLLPEQSVFAYDAGDALGDSCPAGPTRQNWKIYPYYASDLPVLDYTFVHVRWPGQDDAERYRTVEDFEQWLTRNAASKLPGFRGAGGAAGKSLISSITYASASNPDPPPASIPVRLPRYRRCGDSLTSIMTCYSEARPQLVATILLDISGSMALPTASGSPRLDWAQKTGDGIAELAHPADSLKFLPFASSVHSFRPLGQLSQQSLISHLDDQVAINLDRPLATEIDHVIGTLAPGRQNVVILTDGQNKHTNSARAVPDSTLAADIRDRHPGLRVFLALTSGASCTSEPVKTLADALRRAGAGGCVQASGSPAASAAELFADLLRR